MPSEEPISLTDFTKDLKKYFDGVANEIKADKKGKDFTPEQRAMFLELPEHLKACQAAIEEIEQKAFDEFEEEKAATPEGIKNLSPEQIAQILESKKRAKLQGSEIARTLFVIACASDIKMSKCLEFAEQMGVKDLSSFDLNTGLSPLAAAMLRRKNNVAAMQELERAGADISAVSADGKNIAHMAVLFGVDRNTLQYLVAQGKGLKPPMNLFNVKDRNGFTALDMAIGRRDKDFIEYLQKEADAKFAFTPEDVQKAALAGDEAVQELVKSRARTIKGKYSSANPEEEVLKENMDLVSKAMQRPIFDITKSLSGDLTENVRTLEKQTVEVVENNKSSQLQTNPSQGQSEQEQADKQMALAKRSIDEERKIKELREQEQLLRLANRSSEELKENNGPDIFTLLAEVARGASNLAHAVSVVVEVISHDAIAEIEQGAENLLDDNNINKITAAAFFDVAVVNANGDNNKSSWQDFVTKAAKALNPKEHPSSQVNEGTKAQTPLPSPSIGSWVQSLFPEGPNHIESGNHVEAASQAPKTSQRDGSSFSR